DDRSRGSSSPPDSIPKRKTRNQKKDPNILPGASSTNRLRPARRERPRHRAAEKGYQPAPPNHSITSSARCASKGGPHRKDVVHHHPHLRGPTTLLPLFPTLIFL